MNCALPLKQTQDFEVSYCEKLSFNKGNFSHIGVIILVDASVPTSPHPPIDGLLILHGQPRASVSHLRVHDERQCSPLVDLFDFFLVVSSTNINLLFLWYIASL